MKAVAPFLAPLRMRAERMVDLANMSGNDAAAAASAREEGAGGQQTGRRKQLMRGRSVEGSRLSSSGEVKPRSTAVAGMKIGSSLSNWEMLPSHWVSARPSWPTHPTRDFGCGY